MATEKETTAPIPSVAPDGEQPSALARTDSITEIEETHKQFGKIQIMTMPELMETRFRVRPAVMTDCCRRGLTSSRVRRRSASPFSSCRWPIR